MLEFENQMLLDLMYEDGLLIAARGLDIEQVFASLLYSFCDTGNLVLIIGTTQHEEQYLLSLLQQQNTNNIPKQITSDNSINERAAMYKEGGCLFVTSRILVVDLLKDRIPSSLITGIVVWKAHKILESSQEAFILRLYRQKNKTGFIKAFSCNPLSFTIGFCHVERVMKNLFVKKLYLWPRFHLLINECMEKCKPEVIELHLKMSPAMKQIQMSLLDLINLTLQELKLSNRSIDKEEFCTENAISKSFDRIIRIQLDPIWNQLSSRTKQLVADLKVLRTMIGFLSQYDCVTFFNLVSSLRTTEKAMQSAGWMLLSSAEVLFTEAKRRVFGSAGFESPKKKSKTDSDATPILRDVNPEVNPKWETLQEVLLEIKEATKNETRKAPRCLIVTHDEKTTQQLREVLVDGPKKALQRIFYRTIGSSMGIEPPADFFKDDLPHKVPSEPPPTANKGKSTKGLKKQETDQITMTQITKKYDFIGDDTTDEVESISETEVSSSPEKKEKTSSLIEGLLILIQHVKDQSDAFAMNKLLEEVQPKYIIMYDSELSFVRQIEVYQARHPESPAVVYFLLYKGTIEEQIYLTSIKREKAAFEFLIKEKASMVIPEYADGRSGDHPDLDRELIEDEKTENDSTRKGGGASQENVALKTPPKIIVDMREFRSELPAILHKKGIDIEPATIEVGDYILTPETCVERKSISDLIGSLNSGRLYNQALSMTRYYKKPVLLIEFDHNKPFHLQGRSFMSGHSGDAASSRDMAAKLQLLTLHFPRLRLLWCPSPYATAEVFTMLKKGKEEPNIAEAQTVATDPDADFSAEQFNAPIHDFMSKLPGVNSKNIFKLLRHAKNLPELLSLSEEDLTSVLENSKLATQLYSAIHSSMKDVSEEAFPQKARIKTKFGKKTFKRFR